MNLQRSEWTFGGEGSRGAEGNGRRFGTRWRVAAAGIAATLACTAPSWGQACAPVQVLHPSGALGDFFGSAVAVSGTTMVVGVPEDDFGANSEQGSAIVYRWTGSGWAVEATLTAADGRSGSRFGRAVAISGDTAVVGAPIHLVGANINQGAAYVFVRSGTTWTQQARLIAPFGATNDQFGASVAVSGDTAVVGAYLDDVGGNANQGSALVFVRSGTNWTLQAPLYASDGAANDAFGSSVALSGETALVGALYHTVGANFSQGAAYVFTRSGMGWTQQAQLTASDGAASDWFGNSVALDGDTAVVGALNDDIGANADQGSAHIFVRSGPTWTPQAKLIAADGAGADVFGSSVAVSGDTVVVGAVYDDIGTNASQGSAYVFVRSGPSGVWTQQIQFTAADGAANDLFGQSVALSGDTAVVGAFVDDIGANTDQGSAWVFSRIGSTWIGPDMQLLASDGAAGDNFGGDVALDGNTAIVSAYRDDVGTNADQGSVYVFTRPSTIWLPQASLTAPDGAAGDRFGLSVALSGDTAVVGAYSDDIGANADQGSAYIFVRSGSNWTQQAKLVAADGAAGDQFGVSVAISGDTVMVGASSDDIGANANQGSAYVFVRAGTIWSQQAKRTASDGAANDRFGGAVAISGDKAVIGASGDDVGASTNAGSAYVVVRSGTTWAAEAKLLDPTVSSDEFFGASVAISGDTVVVGAPAGTFGTFHAASAHVFVRSYEFPFYVWNLQQTLGYSIETGYAADVAISGDTLVIGASGGIFTSQLGGAFVYVRSAGSWGRQATLAARDEAANDEFGGRVALSGGTVLVGASLDDVGGNVDQGSAWSFGVYGPAVVVHPVPATLCPSPTATFSIVAVGPGTLAYRWQIESPANGGGYVDLAEGAFTEPGTGLSFNAAGAATAALEVASVKLGIHPAQIRFRCVVSNPCGSNASGAATLTVCAADFNCSGSPPTVQDIFDFLAAYFAGDPRADFNGSGVISVQDIFDFLAAYFAGCP